MTRTRLLSGLAAALLPALLAAQSSPQYRIGDLAPVSSAGRTDAAQYAASVVGGDGAPIGVTTSPLYRAAVQPPGLPTAAPPLIFLADFE